MASDRILIPAKADYLSTLGIDYLQKNVEDDSIVQKIDPAFLGVVFTMVQFYGGEPISTQRQFMNQTKTLGLPVFDSYIRENKSVFGDAPLYGVPVVLNAYSNPTHSNIVDELEGFVAEFESKLGTGARP